MLNNNNHLRCLLLVLSFGAFHNSMGQSSFNDGLQKVIIIRHAEKNELGDNLSCQGLNRSLELSNLLYSKFKIPDYIFTPEPKTGKTTNEARMYQTILPYAIKYNLGINTMYKVKDVKEVSKAILKKSGTVLVVWEHNNIPLIAKALGVKDDNLIWQGQDYDSIWIVTFQNGKATLTKEKENLNPSPDCSLK